MQEFLSLLLFVLLSACRVLKIMVFAYVILSWIPAKLQFLREFLELILGPIFSFVRKYSPYLYLF